MIHSAMETVDIGQDPSSTGRLLAQKDPVECKRQQVSHVPFNSEIRQRSRAVASDTESTELMSQQTEVN